MMNIMLLNSQGGAALLNIDCMGRVFGAEVVSIDEEGIDCFGEGQNGNLYLYGKDKVSHYDIRRRRLVAESNLRAGTELIERVSLNGDCLAVLKQTPQGNYLQTRYVPDVLGYIQ